MSDDRLDQLDYYTLLGVSEEASIAQIKVRFREFARKYHPDRFAGASPEKMEQANRIYRRGSEAFQVLTDPRTRAAYDSALEQGSLRLDAEAQDRALAPPRAKEAKPAPVRSPILSPQAQALYRHAVDASRKGDWLSAWRALKAANEVEPRNEFLETRFAQVEARLRTTGF